MSVPHDPYSALRYPSFRRVLTGNVLASFGFEMQHTAVGWELYERTHNAAALGYVGLAQFLPVFLLIIPAGHLADRFSRKWLYVLALGIALVSTTALGLLSYLQGPISLYYVCLLVHGVSRALSAPSRSSLIPLVVPEHELANAITWGASGWQIAATLGPAVGGLLLWAGGAATTVFMLTAGITLVAALSLASVRARSVIRLAEPVSVKTLLAGARFVWNTPLLLAGLTLDLFAVLFGGATALLPIFAKDVLQIDSLRFGLLRAAPSMGAIVMGFTLAHLPLRRAGRTLLFAVAGFGLATIAFGLSLNPYLSFVLLALIGALDNISVVVRGTLVQRLTPDAMRGRVSAVNSMFIVASNELGAFESGITAKGFELLWWGDGPVAFGAIASVVVGGFATFIVVVLADHHWPQIRKLGGLNEVDPVRDAGVTDVMLDERPTVRQ